MLDPAKIDRLLTRVRREVDEGLSPAVQIAIGYQGEIVVDETIGAPADSRFLVYSATKGLVAAAAWRLMDRGLIDGAEPVATYLPEFAENGKGAVTVQHLLTHLGGFPFAPLGPPDWNTVDGRRAAYARWRCEYEPGTTYVYHPLAGHWVLMDVVHAVTGLSHADALEELVTEPLGLPRLLGIPRDQQDGILTTVATGEFPTDDEIVAEYGPGADFDAMNPAKVAIDLLLTLNAPSLRELGVPGGGGCMRAADLAGFYQGLLHNPGGLWSPEVLELGTQRVYLTMPDPAGVQVSRSLGLMLAADGLGHTRGFGRTASLRAFGHDGAGGQLAFADPATGLSVGYCTAGMDQHQFRETRRNIAIASLAADLLTN